MTDLSALWLPILLASVIVFAASSAIHMTPLWHKDDYPRVPDEQAVRNALGPLAIPPGDYMVPRAASTTEMRTPEFLAKLKQGPVVILTVMPNGLFNMGRNLSLWFAYTVVVAVFAGYVASRSLGPGAEYLKVFQIVSTTAFMAHAFALWPMSIWYRRSWSLTLKGTADGLIFAALTAGTFGWLWPR
jgi:hypothetical protein